MTTSTFTPRSSRWLPLLLLGLILLAPGLVRAEEIVPLDPAVRTGKLPNGLTYYIRKNAKPEKRVELRLAVNAGSVNEDDDQRGMAHMVEHLCFQGTARYPGNEIIHYLQSLGAGFGADINAMTGFDETVYMLTLPSDSEEILRKGMGILSDWAHAVTFAPPAIEHERQVIVEEWRTRQGEQGRMSEKWIPLLFQGSPYAQRLPIGTKESIEGTSPDAIRRFYRDWYRPDNMAVVAVGDFDPDQIEALLKAEFGPIPAPGQPRRVQPVTVPDNHDPLIAISADKENASNQILVVWKTAPEPSRTQADFQRELSEILFTTMLNARLFDVAQKENPPFLSAQAGYGRLAVRAKSGLTLEVGAAEGRLAQALTAAYTEVLRVQRHGFTAPELERAKATVLARLEAQYRERDKAPSAGFVDDCLGHFLRDEGAPGIEFSYNFAKSRLPGITPQEVNALAARWITQENRVFLVNAAIKKNVEVPSEASLLAAVQKAEGSRLKPYQEKKLEGGLLDRRPAPGQVANARPLEKIQAVELTFANGIRVVLKPTNFQNGVILFKAFRPGGQSVFPDDHRFSAWLADKYLNNAGIGKYSQTDAQKVLSGKQVGLMMSLSPCFDELKGGATTTDFETLLQLIHLLFAQTRSDESAYRTITDKFKTALESARANPENAYSDESIRFQYGNHPWIDRNDVLPSAADWASVSFAQVDEICRSRFGNAYGYTFVLVGSFDAEKILPLLTSYLGGLPTKKTALACTDHGVRQIAGPQARAYYHGKDAKGIVDLSLDVPAGWSMEEAHRFWSLGNILQRSLRDVLRFKLGGVYSVKVAAQLKPVPSGHTEFNINFECDPAKADQLAAAALAEIKRIQTAGPGPEEIQKEVEAQRRQNETDAKNNGSWLNRLEMVYRDNEPITRLAAPEKMVALVSAPELQALAVQYLDTGKFIRTTLYPEKLAPKSTP